MRLLTVFMVAFCWAHVLRAETWQQRAVGTYSVGGISWTGRIDQDVDFLDAFRVRWTLSNSAPVPFPDGWLVFAAPKVNTVVQTVWELNANQNGSAYPPDNGRIMLVSAGQKVFFWAADNGGPSSPDSAWTDVAVWVTGSVVSPPPSVQRVTLALRNERDLSVTYRVLDAEGNQVGQDITLAPGAALLQGFDTTVAGDFSVVEAIPDLALDEAGNWRLVPGAVTTRTVATVTPTTAETVPTTVVKGASSVPQTTRGTGAVWRPDAPPPPTAQTTDPERLDKATFREGVGKVVDAVKGVDGKVAEVRDQVGTLVERTKSAEGVGTDATSDVRAQKKTEAENLVRSLPGIDRVGSGLNVPGSAASGDWQVRFGPLIFDLNPEREPDMVIAVAWFRSLIEWGLVGVYVWWMIGEMHRFLIAAVLVPQAKGNPVAVGTGAQATALIAASVLTGVVFAVIPVAWAVAELPGVGIAHFWTAAGGILGATGTVIGKVLFLLYFFLPVAFIVNLVGHAFLFRKTAFILHSGIFIAIKFVVP